MPAWKTVAIVGVGLIGGSIGLALRARKLAQRIVGIGRREETLKTAQRLGALTDWTLNLSQGVGDSELIVVCTPVEQIPQHVLAAAGACPAGALITDAGSTKQTILAALNGTLDRTARFIGSHPLAGSEKQGPAEANAELFVGRTVVVTPTRRNSKQDFRDVEAFWRALGADVIQMTPAAHDRRLAASSHLAHLVAAALADAVRPADHPLTAGGFRDTTRIAAGDPELWTQILLDNRQNVLRALEPFERSLAAMQKALKSGSRAQLKRILTTAKIKRDALGS
jgi:prephenate dehydrogenase